MIRLPIGIASPRDPIGVAAAVPALVLVAHDPGDAAQPGDRAQDALADDGVLLHQHPLVVVERPVLVQDRVGDADLADVVEEGGASRRAATSSGLSASACATRTVSSDDGLGVVAGVAVALEQGGGQADDRVAARVVLGADVVEPVAHDDGAPAAVGAGAFDAAAGDLEQLLGATAAAASWRCRPRRRRS